MLGTSRAFTASGHVQCATFRAPPGNFSSVNCLLTAKLQCARSNNPCAFKTWSQGGNGGSNAESSTPSIGTLMARKRLPPPAATRMTNAASPSKSSRPGAGALPNTCPASLKGGSLGPACTRLP